MNPTIGASPCACCGRVDIPISVEYFENNDLKIPSDIITIYPYNIHDHILDPLRYTDEENNYYNSKVSHENESNNQQNRDTWNRYKESYQILTESMRITVVLECIYTQN